MGDSTDHTLALAEDDTHVRRARAAEREAYDVYGLDHTEHYIHIEELGSRIRVVESGSGPPLVLLSGGEGKGMMWLPLIPELDQHTLYVMDRPGGGLSDGIDYGSVSFRRAAASSTAGLLDYFGLDSAPMIGNSMGGLWSLRFALEHPERVSAIGLLGCPAGYPGTSAPLPMRLGSVSLLSGLVVDRLMQPDEVWEVRGEWTFMGHPKETRDRLPTEFTEAWYRMEVLPTYKPTWVGILQRVLRLRGANPATAFTPTALQSIETPVTLLWGREDPFGSVENGRAGAEHFPDAEFHEVGVGHLPWLDAPARCGDLVQELIAERG